MTPNLSEGYIMLTNWNEVSAGEIFEGTKAEGKSYSGDHEETGLLMKPQLLSPSITEVEGYAYSHCYGD